MDSNTAFEIFVQFYEGSLPYNSEVRAAADILHIAGYSEAMIQHARFEMRKHLVNKLLIPNETEIIPMTFYEYVNQCHSMLNDVSTVLKKISQIGALRDGIGELKTDVVESCYCVIQAEHKEVLYKMIYEYYTLVYKCTDKALRKSDLIECDDSDDERDDNSTCVKCIKSECICEQINQSASITTQLLSSLPFLIEVVSSALISVIKDQLRSHILTQCFKLTDQRIVNKLEVWFDTRVLNWMEGIVGKKLSKKIESEMFTYLYTQFINMRISSADNYTELLSLIVEFPESRPALLDMSYCLPKTNLRSELIHAFRTLFHLRLLHPGVATTDILTAYVAAIQALRVFDSSCVILELVTEPIKEYLRSRDDTVRCIVSSLIDDTNGALNEELQKVTVVKSSLNEDNITDEWVNWLPDPIDARKDESVTRRSSDIINMLVNIYGTKELFIKEYWNLLADRLLTTLSYDTLWEIKYFELLKIRFGDSDLNQCEVMLKDISDSKRLNSWINEELNKIRPEHEREFELNAMILSAKYWPPFREEKLTLPSLLADSLQTYVKAYEKIKVNRTLNWEPHLGQVNIDIEMDDEQTVNFKTSPVNVAIIMAFQHQGTYSVEELSDRLQTSTAVIKRRIGYWQTHGLIREDPVDTFHLNESVQERHHDTITDHDAEETATASAEQQREEEYQVLWSYINGMLMNVSVPLDRMHSTLKMFTQTDVTQTELKKFLDRKIREGKLACSAGIYKLPSA